jgi:uncharacterized protein YukE
MQAQLNEKAKKELAAQKERYEQMLDELRRNAAGDKEFVMNELKKKIQELERLLQEAKDELRKEMDNAMKRTEELQAKHES